VIAQKSTTEFSKLDYIIQRIRFQNFQKWMKKFRGMDWNFHWIIDLEMKIKSGLFQKWIYIFLKISKKKKIAEKDWKMHKIQFNFTKSKCPIQWKV